ncbi:hypothetical protein Pd630_LPD13084 (plasmid) [Rhodococcus opacus PD630]|nr:hypothetical protein Pd630_LPD13084 [Rhodococcus opacus PD630]
MWDHRLPTHRSGPAHADTHLGHALRANTPWASDETGTCGTQSPD